MTIRPSGVLTTRIIESKRRRCRSSRRGAVEANLTRNHEVAGSIPGLAHWVKDHGMVAVSYGAGHRQLGSHIAVAVV